MNEFNAMLTRLLFGQLQQIGLFNQPETAIPDPASVSGLLPLYQRWLAESLTILTEQGYLQADGNTYRMTEVPPVVSEALWEEWAAQKQGWLEDADLKAQVILVEATLQALPEILTGKRLATDVMFPNSSLRLVEGIYRQNQGADYFNAVLAETLTAYLEERLAQEPGARIRLLEIGAGTGGTSVAIFRALQPWRDRIQEYCYTDISKAFLRHAEQTYGPENPFLTYRLFNVEQSGCDQGIASGAYDVVIAANVLHATKNIRRTLRNTKAVLKKNGVLLLSEISNKNLFTHLTFGLLEGWWLYEDAELRIPGCPGLSPQTWQTVLESEGFDSVFFPVAPTPELGCQIIYAQSDGSVRHSQSGARAPQTGAATAGAKPRPTVDPSPGKTQPGSRETFRIAAPRKEQGREAPGQMLEEQIKETLIEKLAESLKVESRKIENEAPFADYGVDSITGIQLVQEINGALGIELTTNDLFGYSSVNQLTKYILTQYRDRLIGSWTQNPIPAPMETGPVVSDSAAPAGTAPSLRHHRFTIPAEGSENAGATGRFAKEAIAIIGMSGRWAGSDTVQDLWRNLAAGVDLVTEVQRWNLSEAAPDQNYCRYGSFLAGIDQFDPCFFNISGLEARYMDPQQRFFLEEAWKALEDAGYAGSIGGRNCGVYLGYNGGDYLQLIAGQKNPPAQAMWGNAASIIPARIAYYLNLQGPAITIDTACSSSLVAVHLACQGLWAGETEMALAGGVAIHCTPTFYLGGGKAGMLSASGRCYTFDERADGFVPGEGVGVVVLKRLAEAIAAGDHIYGVIRGSGINQDGTTNGITAPSAVSQERLERSVYDGFGINPETIQMVEAHGTGTKLGDPIEYEALTAAFRHYTAKQAYCALGSIKTNLGHTTAAAGISGLIKILLALKNQQIPASLHYEAGNSRIRFEGSPFYVNTCLRDWETAAGQPRRAAISAFGFSGTNAHLVIEAAPPVTTNHGPNPGYLLVVSARTAEQLRQQVEQILTYCAAEPECDLGNMSYTLLLGRKHFNHRLACVVGSVGELAAVFTKWLEKGKCAQVYGAVLQDQERREQSALKAHGNQIIQSCRSAVSAGEYLERLAAVAELYIQGYELEYPELYAGDAYRRIALPTYPFARESYWVPDPGAAVPERNVTASAATLHPLVHQNTSDLAEQRFSSTFSGAEFFLTDHVIWGQRRLPGVACLEMARVAVQAATGVANPVGIKLKNIVWARPIVVEGPPVRVHIGIYPEGNAEIAYEIYGVSPTGTEIVYSQGSAILPAEQAAPTLDLPALQAECNQNRFSGAAIYPMLERIGFNYGPGHQGIKTLAVGGGQALAKLELPTAVADTLNQYILHPSLLDSALQAAIGLALGDSSPDRTAAKPAVPFALDELEIYAPCTAGMWALIRFSPGNGTAQLQKLDLDLSDEQGNVCVRLKGYTSRVLENEAGSGETPASNGILLLERTWEQKSAVAAEVASAYQRHLVLLCGWGAGVAAAVAAGMPGVTCLEFPAGSQGVAACYHEQAIGVFTAIQNLIQEKVTRPVLIQVVVPGREERQLLAGLSGILATAHLENPNVTGQLLQIPSTEDSAGIIAKLMENRQSPATNIRYQDGERRVAGWREAPISQPCIPWKDGGVYLITGGAGGLGLIFAREIATRIQRATLILAGRSPLTQAQQSQCDALNAGGTRVIYLQADLTDQKTTDRLIERIKNDFGSLHGIIHSAGVIRDNWIFTKSAAEFGEVLAPKVAGLVNLDEATRELPLAFFILFGAAAGSLGNPGQADYAAANAFMDDYAGYRNALVAAGQRQGKTIAVNWPLWKEGGMQVDPAIAAAWQQQAGLVALETDAGIQALYQGLGSGMEHFLVLAGNIPRLRAAFLEDTRWAPAPAANPSGTETQSTPALDEGEIREQAEHYFKQLLAAVIQLPVNRIEADTAMEKYGIDSLMVMQLTNTLETVFGSLSKTLFFEYQTLRELTEYFLRSHRVRLTEVLGSKASPSESGAVTEPQAGTGENGEPNLRSRRRKRFALPAASEAEERTHGVLDIAIIGVAGRYPQARNLREFERNLWDGLDCITEIPPERWDYRRYFDPDKAKPGKTYTKWGGFIEGVDQFDPLFFNISPREAEYMDPQERLFLQCVYETLEDAGYTREALGQYQGLGLEGNVGVFVGVMYEEYQLYGAQAQLQGQALGIPGNPSSIANRVSYFCNFHGPSIAVDTMCSSSLTAIHLACQSMQRGNCELAIAGGVNVSIHPNKYLILGQGKFASSKGRCESFGAGGDGYVPGEGVGAVLLKPLARAVADGDQIYGVIKGTAINHGGKTNGYSVPNPNAQAGVIRQALKMAAIPPRLVSYIEAHGTGTSLGDPIEITGLVKAFQEDTLEQQFCAIGSAKSNIGHCESAAGIAGVTKVLLQLQSGQLFPSLHAEVLNPNIDFSTTPFVVQREGSAWQRPVLESDGLRREYPRVAGISSFGAGGSNAHVVIAEYLPEPGSEVPAGVTGPQPGLILLSARNEARLQEQVRQLLNAITAGRYREQDLAKMAYTLQVGREAMEERLGVIVSSLPELAAQLQNYLDGESSGAAIYRGQVKRNKEALGVFTADEDLQKAVETWVAKGKYAKLVDLWVKGLNFDWNRIYGAIKPGRISLPTYPFARERYWAPVETGQQDNLITAAMHPLVQRNISDLTEQRYTSTFTGAEFFLADHRIGGRKLLPGVASLEMARAAIAAATGESLAGLRLQNVVWLRPLAVEAEPVAVQIGIYPESNGELGYEIYNGTGENEVVYSRGSAVIGVQAEPPVIDLLAIKAQCNQGSLDAAQIYPSFQAIGIEYGPSHRGIEKLEVGTGMALAQLGLPEAVAHTRDQFGLHPSILDGALQAALGLLLEPRDHRTASQAFLPFALDEMEIYDQGHAKMWAWVRPSADSGNGDPFRKLDIDLVDAAGKVAVRMKGYTARVVEGVTPAGENPAESGRLILAPVWQEQAVPETLAVPEYVGQLAILCEPDSVTATAVAQEPGIRCLQFHSQAPGIEQRFQAAALQVLETIQELLGAAETGKILIQVVVVRQAEQQLYSGLSGLLQTARLENPRVIGQLIEVEAGETPSGLTAKLRENRSRPQDSRIRYQAGKRWIKMWHEPELSAEERVKPWKEQGIYLITGGAGGLGLIFAREIASQVPGATLILTGRSELTAAQQIQLQALEQNGTRLSYRQVDVADRKAVTRLIQTIRTEYGGLNGIIHSAGVIRDNYIIKKTPAECQAVFAPKVTGVVNLDEASRDLELDLMILFSSLAAPVGNPGQADYAAANAFLDSFAEYRNELAARQQRQGRTIAFNWPLWQEGGMHLEATAVKLLQQNTGMIPLQTRTGIDSLYLGLASNQPQIMVTEGNLRRLRALFLNQSAPAGLVNAVTAQERNHTELAGHEVALLERAIPYFKKLLARVIKLPVEQVDAEVSLEHYGIDSVMVIELTTQLETTFGPLSKTLFFEYQTLAALTGYFLRNHSRELTTLMGSEAAAAAATATGTNLPEAPTGLSRRTRSNGNRRFQGAAPQEGLEVAIIGVAGRYPQARNLQEFWQNLRDGKDCITPIPAERWDHRPYFDPDPNRPGKTYSQWGGFIEGVAEFDPLFFNIAPREAEFMDPQERLFLQCVYETLEDAGYTRETLQTYQGLEGNVGVFVGVMYEEYQLYGAQEQSRGNGIALPGSPASIANRVSYFCNFHGPSIAVDTMCSSSLTAIHLACQSLQRGGCELAVAGGVNISIHPNKYLLLGQGKFASSNGRCASFGAGGDGYVPGEGVGAVLLKPLAQAIHDGDHIYGIIKGTAINHGGKTNGYSVPNPNAQAGVIDRALKAAGIDPRMISYLEAHGTGTALGDPIEIAGLVKTFREYTQEQQFCAIGSVKSNIGHCESAAGIAGVTKVLLQLQHGQLVPSLHAERLNPNIDFSNTPFVVQQTGGEWKRPRIETRGTVTEVPRLAGISSFGAGGSNAHVLIAEYLPAQPNEVQPAAGGDHPAVILLSAKNEARLKDRVRQLVAALQAGRYTGADLAKLAYTLQVGREAMEERVGFLAGSFPELEAKLQTVLDGKADDGKIWHGQIKPNKAALAVFTADEDLQKAIESWVAKGKYAKLVDLWVKGLSFDWNRIYGPAKPGRISLPPYPFARERYWAPGAITQQDNRLEAALHPLVQRNTSDLTEQCYSSRFTGAEFFLADHVIQGQKLLPGAAYLEMARAAVAHAAGAALSRIRLKNVVWLRPLRVGDEPVEARIGIYPEENGDIAYEIYYQAGEAELVCCQGSAVIAALTEPPVLDLPATQARCNQRRLDAASVYQSFSQLGLAYGPAHQGIHELQLGAGEVLARLDLPEPVLHTREQFILHPSIIDAAFQASLGLTVGSEDAPPTLQAALPFALRELEFYGGCNPAMWAWVRESEGSRNGGPIRKLDLDLCDATGKIAVRIKGYTAKVLEAAVTGPEKNPAHHGAMLLAPVWQVKAAAGSDEAGEELHQLVILCERDEATAATIAQALGVRCIHLQSQAAGIDERFRAAALQVLETLQNLLADPAPTRTLIQIVVSREGEQQLYSGLFGLVQTAQLENPRVIGQLIASEAGEEPESLAAKLRENRHCLMDSRIRYQGGQRWIQAWNEVPPVAKEAQPWRDRGIYLISGGTGGLGLLLAREIATQVPGATLILIGRSELRAAQESQLHALAQNGTRLEYRQVDVADPKAVTRLFEAIRNQYGGLNGIIHSAGVIRDHYLLQKTGTELQEVLAPKVSGLVNLDQASQELALDFMIIFSSLAGALGNPGQADYAAANAFMDSFVEYRNALVASRQRQGRTIGFNWPLWQEGGMQLEANATKLLQQSTGMLPLTTVTGLRALYQGLASTHPRMMVVEGNLSRIQQKLFAVPPVVPTGKLPAESAVPAAAPERLVEQVQNGLMKAVSRLLKVRMENLDGDLELSEYGFDSVSLAELTNILNEAYGLELMPTIFFEYPTLHRLAQHLLQAYPANFESLPGEASPLAEVAVTVMDPAEVTPIVPMGENRRSRLPRNRTRTSGTAEASVDPIAIIGMSGTFPQARDLEAFWQNLVAEQDCIGEIPPDRWDWKAYYGDPAQEANKTNIKWGGFIEGVAEFDPLFFGISPREAELMDPQQRLLMTYVWKTMEDAGYSGQSLAGTPTAIFVGTANTGYDGLIAQANIPPEGYSSTGSVASVGPNRMSYFLNIHGPSEPVETACSSSLVALHRAVTAIQTGSCEMAFVGGINTILSPSGHISFNKTGMLSEDGRCKTFSAQANGYVRGEGVGMLLIKKLSAAEAAGDHIYAVIRGTAENHGGRANSLTAPNPKAQAALLQTAYTRAGIDPRTVTYIEAHGTGTELGDPIEINGLKMAFAELYRATGDPEMQPDHCGLGSVKTNIGHLELAAGVAGVIKVLLQFQHHKLAKSLHCETINPYIQLQDSPFYIVRETRDWEALRDAQGRALPRRAGVSSFGFGGVNAHVILEEYLPPQRSTVPVGVTAQNPAVIVLSAKQEDRLKEQAGQLLAALETGRYGAADLADLAYTLQIGRETMEERLGFLAGSLAELQAKLQSYLDGKDREAEVYHGQVKRNKETLNVFTADEDLQKAIDSWVAKGKYAKLVELWVKGLLFDWNRIYGTTKPRRISLPTYPFSRERYWVPQAPPAVKQESPAAAFLHPLVQRNTSDFAAQRYSTTFSGQEFFLAGHVVKGRRLLPGVAYLEMARAAIEQAAGEDTAGLCLQDVVWIRPLEVADEPVEANIELSLEENGAMGFSVYSQSGDDALVYSQGSAQFMAFTETPYLDLPALKAQCTRKSFGADQIYHGFKIIGIEYGPGHRGIEAIYIGKGMALAKLRLPDSIADTEMQYGMHPGMMDAALQAAIGLLMEASFLRISVPFSLQELEIYGRCSSEMWALVRYKEGSNPKDKVQKLDIDVCDRDGNVRVRMKGYTSRILDGEAESVEGMLILEPYWREMAVMAKKFAPEYARRLVMVCGPDAAISTAIADQLGVPCLYLPSKQPEPDRLFQEYAVQLFAAIQKVLAEKLSGKTLLQVVVINPTDQHLLTGLYGILKTAEFEYPTVFSQLIEVEAGETAAGIVAKLQENRPSLDNQIRYPAGNRQVIHWRELQLPAATTGIPWQDYGTYLITGGAGGLGFIFVREIIAQVKGVTLILTGRSELSAARRSQLKALEQKGAKIIYRQVDVVDKAAVTRLIQSIREEYGGLNGIMHCAGIIRDNFIIRKTQTEFQEVLAPKVSGLVNLDEASKDLELDFMFLFSSVVADMGNIGQADYAAANAFMNSYAEYRNGLVAAGQRQGQTVAFNWSLWNEGGIKITEDSKKSMKKNSGMVPLQTAIGIQRFYQVIAAGKSQAMILEGDLIRLQNFAGHTLTGLVEVSDSLEFLDETFYETLGTRILQGEISDAQFEALKERMSGSLAELKALGPVTEPDSPSFYHQLTEKIAQGELSEDQLAMILSKSGGTK